MRNFFKIFKNVFMNYNNYIYQNLHASSLKLYNFLAKSTSSVGNYFYNWGNFFLTPNYEGETEFQCNCRLYKYHIQDVINGDADLYSYLAAQSFLINITLTCLVVGVTIFSKAYLNGTLLASQIGE